MSDRINIYLSLRQNPQRGFSTHANFSLFPQERETGPARNLSVSEAALQSREHDEIASLGGLHIIGTERHEARRVDNQLRGRSGRQGDPGSSQFFVALEDDLMRIFGGDRIKSLMGLLKVPEDEAIEAKMISSAIESAQSKIEGMHFDARRYVLEYDDVLNKHREGIYRKRKEFLQETEDIG